MMTLYHTLTSSKTDVLAMTAAFLDFFSWYAFSLSSVILFFSSVSSSSLQKGNEQNIITHEGPDNYLDPKRSTSSSSSAAAAAGAAPPRAKPELALGNCFMPLPKDLMWLYLRKNTVNNNQCHIIKIQLDSPAKGMSVLRCSSKSFIHLCVRLAWHIPETFDNSPYLKMKNLKPLCVLAVLVEAFQPSQCPLQMKNYHFLDHPHGLHH